MQVGADMSDACDLFFGTLNWIEIGSEDAPVLAIRGRHDVVQFCCEALVPALRQVAFDERGEIVLAAGTHEEATKVAVQ